jgi:hypothetical protein
VPNAWTSKPDDQDALRSKAVAEQAERDAPAEARESLHAIYRHRQHQRYAAGHRVAHGVEDRAGVRGAAEEVRDHEDQELRRTQCLARVIAGAESGCGSFAAAWLSSAGGRRTRNETGIMTAATRAAMISIEARQLWCVTSQAASGDMVIGAMPMPAETSDTARLRRVSNQPVTQAIIGAKIAEVLAPMRRPKRS